MLLLKNSSSKKFQEYETGVRIYYPFRHECTGADTAAVIMKLFIIIIMGAFAIIFIAAAVEVTLQKIVYF
jgi:hypothetical protein